MADEKGREAYKKRMKQVAAMDQATAGLTDILLPLVPNYYQRVLIDVKNESVALALAMNMQSTLIAAIFSMEPKDEKDENENE